MATKLFFLSDARSFSNAYRIAARVEPDYVIMLGDLLYDGSGQEYILDQASVAKVVKSCNNVRVYRLCNNTYLVRDYTSTCKHIYDLHVTAFMDAIEKLILNGINVYIVIGNHDYEVNYQGLIIQHLGHGVAKKVTVVRRPLSIEIAGFTVLLLPYQPRIKYPRQLLCQSDIIATHAELRQIRAIVGTLSTCDRVRLLVSGHWGVGYYPPDRLEQALVAGRIERNGHSKCYPKAITKTHLVRIDNFPYSYLAMQLNENGKRISGRLKIIKRSLLLGPTCVDIIKKEHEYGFTIMMR